MLLGVLEIALITVVVILIVYILWYFFLTDRSLVLALAEVFGSSVASYEGKVVWVTGSSSGLGEAMALELASVGTKLILSARNRALLEEVRQKCIEKSQGKLTNEDVLLLPLDICNCDAHRNCVNEALNHFKQIDVLINNVGMLQVGAIATTDRMVETEIFDVNFFGNINLTKLLLKHFLEKGKGQFVVISSIGGKCAIPASASYVATKHALQGYYETLGMEYSSDKINVTIVCPGIFKSAGFRKKIFGKCDEIKKNEPEHYECNQMISSRTGHLALVAAANKICEAWVANQPFLFMMWLAQYMPDFNRRVMKKLVYTKRRVNELNQATWPTDLPTWRPLF